MPRDRRPRLRLLPREDLVATSELDRAEWNYRPLLGFLQRKRFELARSLLGEAVHDRLLEVGYGSGVFMPTLAQRCRALHGVDRHGQQRQVARRLAGHGVRAELESADVCQLPYGDSLFECVVAVSTLEFVEPIEAAVAELARVLRPDGFLVVVTPGRSPLLDLALKAATGESARRNYADRRRRLVPQLLRRFQATADRRFPTILGRRAVYRALRLEPVQAASGRPQSASRP